MRREILEAGLAGRGAQALLVLAESSRDPDAASFTGSAHLGQCFVLARPGSADALGYLVDMEREEAASTGLELIAAAGRAQELRRSGAPESDVWIELLAGALEDAGLAGSTIALAGRPPAGRAHAIAAGLEARGFEFTDGHSLIRALRKTKSDAEIDAVRHAAAGTCQAFRRVAEVLAGAEVEAGSLSRGGTPLTAGDLRREITLALAAFGLEQPEGNIVAAGAAAAVPHNQGADSVRLEAGRSIIVDLYPKGPLFADCTRTFCVGEPGEKLAAAHSLCLSALETAQRKAKPGVAGTDLDDEVCRTFEAAGFATAKSEPGTRTGYVHGLGHGVGYELHELPSFRPAAGDAGGLELRDVFTLEPGLYSPEDSFGVRIENLLVMTESGPENLTPLPYDLDPGAW